jgi:hypothetical protein
MIFYRFEAYEEQISMKLKQFHVVVFLPYTFSFFVCSLIICGTCRNNSLDLLEKKRLFNWRRFCIPYNDVAVFRHIGNSLCFLVFLHPSGVLIETTESSQLFIILSLYRTYTYDSSRMIYRLLWSLVVESTSKMCQKLQFWLNSGWSKERSTWRPKCIFVRILGLIRLIFTPVKNSPKINCR